MKPLDTIIDTIIARPQLAYTGFLEPALDAGGQSMAGN